MAGKYPLARVGDLTESISETHRKNKQCLIFLNTSDILHGKFLHRTYTAVRDWPGQAKKSIQKNDILFSEIRPANGRWAYVGEDADDFVVSTKLMVIRARKDRLFPKFLYQFLTSSTIAGWLQHLAESRSGTFPQITFDQIASLEIPLPSLSEQQAIAYIIGTLDNKIELNRRMNETLEAMARAIFKSWFMDFDPVRAKAEGQQPAGLATHIAALFPDSLEDSELGKIPSGWRVSTLPELVHINPTRSLPKGTLAPYLDMANMPTQGPSPDIWVMREMGSGMKFINGDTLVARITPCLENGKTAFVDFLTNGEVGWGSTEYIVLRPKGVIPPMFAYLLARTDEFRTFAIQQMTGSSGRQRVPATSLDKYMISSPVIGSPLFRHFGTLVSPMFDRIKAAMVQYRTFAALRDALLPKLISGELRVPDAERIVGRTV